MKKAILFFIVIVMISFSFIVGCSKTKQTSDVKESVQKLRTGIPLSIANTPATLQQKTKPGCGCQQHGGTLFGTIIHYLATCRSECTRGLGFRCGSAGWYVCNDGAIVACPGGHCPISHFVPEREMRSTITFYNNGTAKLQFQRPVPVEETGNTVFEIGEDIEIEIPDDVMIDGTRYESFVAKSGNYFIDYSDGQYGSVVVYTVLKQ